MYKIKNLLEKLVEYWAKEVGFSKLPSEFNKAASLVSPYFPSAFNPSVGAGILDYKIKEYLTKPDWRKKNKEGDLYYIKGMSFRSYDIDSVKYSDDHLSLFYSFACFAINNPDNPRLSKEITIESVYNFLVKGLGLDPQNILVSYFAGGYLDGISCEPDNVSFNKWKSVGVKEENMIPSHTKLNFLMSAAEQYPESDLLSTIGPRNEIFYLFQKTHIHKFTEIATIQFSSGIRKSEKIISPLPTFPAISFGIERLLMVLNSYNNIFQTELLKPLINDIYKLARIDDSISFIKELVRPEIQTIVDHVRALFFLIFDINRFENEQVLTKDRKTILNRLKRNVIHACGQLEIDPLVATKILVKNIYSIYKDFYPLSSRILQKIGNIVIEAFRSLNGSQ